LTTSSASGEAEAVKTPMQILAAQSKRRTAAEAGSLGRSSLGLTLQTGGGGVDLGGGGIGGAGMPGAVTPGGRPPLVMGRDPNQGAHLHAFQHSGGGR
jgi:hypothetical protein